MTTILANLQDRSQVSTPVTVVRCGPDGHKLLVKHEFISFLYELVCPSNEFQGIEVVELLRDASTEEPARTARAHRPIFNLVWVRPHEIFGNVNVGSRALKVGLTTETPFVGNFLCSGKESNLV